MHTTSSQFPTAPKPATVPRTSPGGVNCRANHPVRIDGKFFALDGQPWELRGLTYGPFRPNHQGWFLPDAGALADDFARIHALGANCLRLYHPPTLAVLDAAAEHDLRVLVDVPWDKHRCFFEDWPARRQALQRVAAAARELGPHPALLALSVANEFPVDIVRFSGHRRVARFVDELWDAAKQAAPDVLVTFANYPTTEFLIPRQWDFACFNVYLEDEQALSRYLDRLQHWAGNKPLVLGEFGADSIRHGETGQARLTRSQLTRIADHGLAGSFLFSYTDDWFSGGRPVEGWGFGVTRRDRSEKLVADVLRQAWKNPHTMGPSSPRGAALPRVSVIVCSYNGAATLRECLGSLAALDYPDYEVILVDDGSTDHTQQIAADFPEIVNIRQSNQGLSAARNVGAHRATGSIVAYTDSDCIAHPLWLKQLIAAMLRQKVGAIGGPNIAPPSDNWVARCVAVSPGGPSHVMLDDQLAEHVPGCNMAFHRDVLLGIGGFDPQFRQAGDDVDICWRLIDAGHRIGFAAGAQVWHHRRATLRAYLKQQEGYGRSEAMLLFKHPRRFNALGASRWHGVIYGEGAVGFPVLPPTIYHGLRGSSPFQSIYRGNEFSLRIYPMLLEWHLVVLTLAVFGAFCRHPMLLIAIAMSVCSLAAATALAWTAVLPPAAPVWCRPLVFLLHCAQPVVRSWHRYTYRLLHKRLPDEPTTDLVPLLRTGIATRSIYWSSRKGIGREHLLNALTTEALAAHWHPIQDDEWASWDVLLNGDRWHNLLIWSATEELGNQRRFTRLRMRARTTLFARTLMAADVSIGLLALAAAAWHAAAISAVALLLLLFALMRSRTRCFARLASLLGCAARAAGFNPRLEPLHANDDLVCPEAEIVAT